MFETLKSIELLSVLCSLPVPMKKVSKAVSKLVLAAVPEQVNIPIQICFEKDLFCEYNNSYCHWMHSVTILFIHHYAMLVIAKHGIEVEHRIVPEGTGRMLDLLEEGAVDIALTVRTCFCHMSICCLLAIFLSSYYLLSICRHSIC